MAFTYNADLSTPADKVRLLCNDVDLTHPVFTDAEIAALLLMEADSIKRSAALGLETIASNEVMVLKVMSLLEITTDGAKVSDALLKRAAVLRKQADDADAAALALLEDTPFDYAEQVYDSATYYARAWNVALRGGV